VQFFWVAIQIPNNNSVRLDRRGADVRDQIIDLALEVPELSPRELAVRFIDERKYFVSAAEGP
jgi:hypothetical protein